jgi:hypothetical protein
VQRKSHHHLLTKYIYPFWLHHFSRHTNQRKHLSPANSRGFYIIENMRERERERGGEGGREREREREMLKT